MELEQESPAVYSSYQKQIPPYNYLPPLSSSKSASKPPLSSSHLLPPPLFGSPLGVIGGGGGGGGGYLPLTPSYLGGYQSLPPPSSASRPYPYPPLPPTPLSSSMMPLSRPPLNNTPAIATTPAGSRGGGGAGGGGGGGSGFFSPDDFRNYQTQFELTQAITQAAQETAYAKVSLTSEEYEIRWNFCRALQKSFDAKALKNFIAYDPTLPLTRLYDLSALAEDGQTPLHIAAKFGAHQAIKLFAEMSQEAANAAVAAATAAVHEGEEKSEVQEGSVNPSAAAATSIPSIVFSVWVRDLQGRTPLHLAAEHGQIETCKLLRELMKQERPDQDPVGINAPVDMGGTTPLGWAKKSCKGKPKVEIENVLFDRGDPSILQKTPAEKRIGKSPWSKSAAPNIPTMVSPPSAPVAASSSSSSSSSSDNLIYAFSEAQGWSPMMEDRITIACPVKGRQNWSFFAVFDGHGGSFVSNYLSYRFPVIISEIAYEFEQQMQSHLLPGGVNNDLDTTPELLQTILCQACLKADEELKNHPRLLVKKQKSTGNLLIKDSSGSTGILALITLNYIAIGNVGDSRAVLAKRSSDAPKLSELRNDPFAMASSGKVTPTAANSTTETVENETTVMNNSRKKPARRSSLKSSLEAYPLSRDHKLNIPEEKERALKAEVK